MRYAASTLPISPYGRTVRVVGCSRLLVIGEGYRLGEFTCPAGQDLWGTTNWIGPEPHVVFPRTAVRIIADGAEPHVCTANDVLVYAADTHYRRELVSTEGDRCLYVAVSLPLADERGCRCDRSRTRCGTGRARLTGTRWPS